MYCTRDQQLTKKPLPSTVPMHDEVLSRAPGLFRALQARLEIFGCILASNLVQ